MKPTNILFLLLVLSSPWLKAATILDQNTLIDFGDRSMEIGSAEGSFFNGYFRRSQTFTAGIAGYLNKLIVDFKLTDPGSPPVYAINILQTDATGAPTDNILATVTSFSWDNNLATFDFSFADLYLQSNSVYAFEVIGGLIRANNSGITGSPVAALYAGGSDYYKYAGMDNWVPNVTTDLRFQTYVAEVPLPASIVFLGSALLGLFSSRTLAAKRRNS